MNAPRIRAVIVEGELDAAAIAQIRRAIASPDLSLVTAPPMVSDVIARIGFEMGLTTAGITGRGLRSGELRARCAVSWIARELGRSTTETGRAMGDRDHSTIVYQLRKADAMRRTDPAFIAVTDKVLRHFNNGGLA